MFPSWISAGITVGTDQLRRREVGGGKGCASRNVFNPWFYVFVT